MLLQKLYFYLFVFRSKINVQQFKQVANQFVKKKCESLFFAVTSFKVLNRNEKSKVFAETFF